MLCGIGTFIDIFEGAGFKLAVHINAYALRSESRLVAQTVSLFVVNLNRVVYYFLH